MVAATVYRPVEMSGVEVILEPRSQEILQQWPGQWLNLVIDGTEHLLALHRVHWVRPELVTEVKFLT